MSPDKLGQAFIVHLVMLPQYKDRHKVRRLIMRLHELCSILCLKRRPTNDSSSRRIMRRKTAHRRIIQQSETVIQKARDYLLIIQHGG
jgi:hypothetical protein